MRFARFAQAILLTSIAASVAAQPAPPPHPDLMLADRQLATGDAEGAVVVLNTLARRVTEGAAPREDLPQVYLLLGVAHSMLNAEPVARGAFAAALDLDRSLSLDSDRWPSRAIRLLEDVRARLPPAEQLVLDPNLTDAEGLLDAADRLRKAGNLDSAEAAHHRLIELYPGDRHACRALVGFLSRPLWKGQTRFEEAMVTAERCAALDPNDAEGQLLVAMMYWDEAIRNPRLDDAQKGRYADGGLEFVDKALAIDPDFLDALVYKGMLKRMKAIATQDLALRARYLEEAQALRDRAMELKQQRDAQRPPGQ